MCLLVSLWREFFSSLLFFAEAMVQGLGFEV